VSLRVYRIPFSTNVERVALAAGHKGLEIDWIDVDPADRSSVRAISGQDLVPVAVFEDGTVVADSTAVLEDLERRHPDPPLYPSAEPRRTELRLFIDWFNRVWKRPPNELEAELRAQAPDPERIRALERELAGSRDQFEVLLAQRDFLFGDGLSAADCVAFPFLKYGLIFDPDDDEPFHLVLIEHLALGGGYPRLEAWIHRIDAHRRA
jgi:glutathione S-transferase